MSVRLVPMSTEEFQAFYEWDVRDYANDLVRGGFATPENSLKTSREQLEQLLPKGQETPHHHFDTIVSTSDETRVGEVWYAIQDSPSGRELFVFWLGIDPSHRRKGYATDALRILEETARQEKLRHVALSVFAHNPAGRELYDRLGYVPRVIALVKPIADR